MSRATRVGRPSWQVRDGGLPRPELWLCAVIVVAVLLTEVWQSSRMAQLCLRLDQTRSKTEQTQNRFEFAKAELERCSTRAQTEPIANALGLEPVQPQQVVALPADYLAEDVPAARRDDRGGLLAVAERISGALVPDATARSRATR